MKLIKITLASAFFFAPASYAAAQSCPPGTTLQSGVYGTSCVKTKETSSEKKDSKKEKDSKRTKKDKK